MGIFDRLFGIEKKRKTVTENFKSFASKDLPEGPPNEMERYKLIYSTLEYGKRFRDDSALCSALYLLAEMVQPQPGYKEMRKIAKELGIEFSWENYKRWNRKVVTKTEEDLRREEEIRELLNLKSNNESRFWTRLAEMILAGRKDEIDERLWKATGGKKDDEWTVSLILRKGEEAMKILLERDPKAAKQYPKLFEKLVISKHEQIMKSRYRKTLFLSDVKWFLDNFDILPEILKNTIIRAYPTLFPIDELVAYAIKNKNESLLFEWWKEVLPRIEENTAKAVEFFVFLAKEGFDSLAFSLGRRIAPALVRLAFSSELKRLSAREADYFSLV